MYNLLTCADAKYYHLAYALAKNIALFPNYRLFLYDLGLTEKQCHTLTSLNVHIEQTVFDPNTFTFNRNHNIRTTHKINCIEHFIQKYKQNVLVLDSDILILEDVALQLLPQQNQVILTKRCLRECKPHILINGKINAGVMAFGLHVEHAFFEAWRTLCEDKDHTDQSALSALIDPYLDWEKLNVPQLGPHCEIVLLDGNIYNDVTCRSGKIFHFKNAGRQKNKRIGHALFAGLQRLLPKLTARLIRWNRTHRIYIWKA